MNEQTNELHNDRGPFKYFGITNYYLRQIPRIMIIFLYIFASFIEDG